MAVVINGTTGVSGVDGSAGTPSYQGTDSNTGIFFPAADTIAFGEGGAEAMRIDSSGNVGIGTTAPDSKLSIDHSSTSTSVLASYANIPLLLQNTSSTDNNWSVIGVQDASGDFSSYIGTQNTSQSGNTAIMAFATNGGSGATERMRIDSSGNLLVNTTTSRNARVTIQQNTIASSSTAALAIESDVNGEQGIIFTKGQNLFSGPVAAITATPTSFGSTSAGALIFRTNASNDSFPTERARITSGGYFKASNSGSYISTTSTYHECYQTADSVTLYCTGYNNSYTNPVIATQVQRSANSAYGFFEAYSGLSDREFQLRGDGNAYADGTWNNNGADYAEYFESVNGQALSVGATVVLDGNKVREATSQDPASAIIGVVRPKEPSKASMVVGNTAWNKWANKYLTDDFDRYIMEDHDVVEWEETVTDDEGKTSTKQHSYESHNIPAGITVPADAVRKTHDDKGNKFQHYKLNPAWDKDAEYVNRENRPEWNIIGLLGQVKILKGQPVGDRWIKMRDVSSSVEEWMIR